MQAEPQSFRLFTIEDSSSALAKHGKSMDEVPAALSKIGHDSADGVQIRQVSPRDYRVGGSLFTSSPANGMVSATTSDHQNDLVYFGLLLLPVLIALFIIRSSFSRVQGAFRALFNNRYSSIFIRNFSLSNNIATYFTIFNSVVVLSLGIWLQWHQSYSYEPEQMYFSLLIVFGIIATIFICRYLVILLCQAIFITKESTEQYLYRDYYSKTILATVVPFFVFAGAFSPFTNLFWYSTIIIACLSIAYGIISAVLVGISERTYGLFYFILYFCTVEIAPVVFALKLLSERILLF